MISVGCQSADSEAGAGDVAGNGAGGGNGPGAGGGNGLGAESGTEAGCHDPAARCQAGTDASNASSAGRSESAL